MQLWLIDTCVAAETAESNNDFVYPDEITKSIILYYRMFNSRSIYSTHELKSNYVRKKNKGQNIPTMLKINGLNVKLPT